MSPILEADEVTVTYGGLTAVDRASLSVDAGNMYGIIGPNGAGKTTFFDALTGLSRTSHGRVLLEGRDITRWSPHRRVRAGLRRGFQTVGLISGLSVRDNVLVSLEGVQAATTPFPRPSRNRARLAVVDRALDQFGLLELRDVAVHELPFGTSKLVELAKPFVGDPKVILLDEPFAGLSAAEAHQRAGLLADRCAEASAAIIVVEHNVAALARMCSHLTVLDYGHVVTQGEPDDVLNDKRVREAYMGDVATIGEG